MVGLGILFLASTGYACWCWWRGTLFRKRWLLWYFVFAVGPAFVANQSGWVAAEVGRQPWIVYPVRTASGELVGGLRTAAGVSEVVRAEQVIGSMAMFLVLYTLLFALWVFLLNRTIQAGPEPTPVVESGPSDGPVWPTIAARVRHQESLSGPREETR
jgi:cytochrome d ubiquinol oxidase subunit I